MSASSSETEDDRAPDGPPGLPRWGKLLAIGAIIAVAVIVLTMLLLGGEHGPGMHGG